MVVSEGLNPALTSFVYVSSCVRFLWPLTSGHFEIRVFRENARDGELQHASRRPSSPAPASATVSRLASAAAVGGSPAP
eukprot:scaffold1483_cov374-Pavlova_lutheri.AAC.6